MFWCNLLTYLYVPALINGITEISLSPAMTGPHSGFRTQLRTRDVFMNAVFSSIAPSLTVGLVGSRVLL